MRFAVLLLGAALVAGGCSQKLAVDAYQAPQVIIGSESSFYVLRPENGRYGEKTYPDSGAATMQAAVAALAVHVATVVAATGVEDLTVALSAAQAAGLTYVFEPTILNWEDRATEWSGKPDRITVRFAVHEVSTGAVVASTVARASSKWGTFGGDHPQDLLPLATSNFVDSLF